MLKLQLPKQMTEFNLLSTLWAFFVEVADKNYHNSLDGSSIGRHHMAFLLSMWKLTWAASKLGTISSLHDRFTKSLSACNLICGGAESTR